MSRFAFDFEFESGLTLLSGPSVRSPAVHRIACARLRDVGGPAYWIDAGNAASTRTLYDCAPSDRTLRDLHVARAFTAHQHLSLARRLVRVADRETTLVVAPNAAVPYRDDDLAAWEREDLLDATLETLRELGRVLSCPVVVTATDGDAAASVADRADAELELECVRTREGLRIEGDGETIEGYARGDRRQTTIPYWVERAGVVDAGDPAVAGRDRGLLEVIA